MFFSFGAADYAKTMDHVPLERLGGKSKFSRAASGVARLKHVASCTDTATTSHQQHPLAKIKFSTITIMSPR